MIFFRNLFRHIGSLDRQSEAKDLYILHRPLFYSKLGAKAQSAVRRLFWDRSQNS